MFLEGKALLKTYISQLEIYRSALVPGHEAFHFLKVRGGVPERILAHLGCVDMGAWYGRRVLPGTP